MNDESNILVIFLNGNDKESEMVVRQFYKNQTNYTILSLIDPYRVWYVNPNKLSSLEKWSTCITILHVLL